MRDVLGRGICRLATFAMRLGRSLTEDLQEARVKLWREANGDETLRLDYELDASSRIIDAGGYDGQWTAKIFAKYGCYVDIFEPIPSYAAAMESWFARNPKIHVHTFGLAAKSAEMNMTVAGVASSAIKGGAETVRVEMRSLTDLIESGTIAMPIDLIKINIEGGEYDLLEHILDHGLQHQLRNIQVQFHDFVQDAEERMQVIQSCLARSHDCTYSFPFVWENWTLRNSL